MLDVVTTVVVVNIVVIVVTIVALSDCAGAAYMMFVTAIVTARD